MQINLQNAPVDPATLPEAPERHGVGKIAARDAHMIEVNPYPRITQGNRI